MTLSLKNHFYFIVNFYITFSIKFIEAAIFYPGGSAFAVFAAIAVPLDLMEQNVFLSYNFEANYNLPTMRLLPPLLDGIEDEDVFGTRDCKNCTVIENISSPGNVIRIREGEDSTTVANEAETTTETITEIITESTTDEPKLKKTKKRQQRSLLSRTHFYHILMDKFERNGFKAEGCLLRLICETNSSDLGDINGILGNIVHIIFSPSTSKNEELPPAYYKAEIDGAHNQCAHYQKGCEKNLLDLISMPLVDIVQNIINNKL